MAIWSTSPFAVYLGHSELSTPPSASGFIPLSSVFLSGWMLMVTAMMLPTVLPLLTEFRRILSGRGISGMVALPLVLGYLAWWLPFGFLAYGMDFGIHRLADTPLLQGNLWVLGASALAIAGGYQFTSAKRNFLRDCCYPGDFIRSHWNKETNEPRTFRLGLNFGRADMGSHWALMLLMFALELGSIPGMIVMGTAMAAEKAPKLSSLTRIIVGSMLVGTAIYLGLASLV